MEYTAKELSVTIARKRRDVSAGDVERMQRILDALRLGGDLVRAEVALEPGGQEDHMHFQAVIELVCSSPAAVTRWIRETWGFNAEAFYVTTRELAQAELHTWVGMIGYVHKFESDPRWRLVWSHGVTEQERQAGRDEYARYGNVSRAKKAVVITPNTVFRKAWHWHCTKDRHALDTQLSQVVTKMLHTGVFQLSAGFIVRKGGGGFDQERADALWQSLAAPEQATKEQVEFIMYGAGRYRYWQEPQGQEQPLLDPATATDAELFGANGATAIRQQMADNHGPVQPVQELVHQENQRLAALAAITRASVARASAHARDARLDASGVVPGQGWEELEFID